MKRKRWPTLIGGPGHAVSIAYVVGPGPIPDRVHYMPAPLPGYDVDEDSGYSLVRDVLYRRELYYLQGLSPVVEVYVVEGMSRAQGLEAVWQAITDALPDA